MVERMAKIETDITYIKKAQDHTNNKLDQFINSVDNKYAKIKIENVVNDNTQKIANINIIMAKWIGGGIALSTIITWIITFFIK